MAGVPSADPLDFVGSCVAEGEVLVGVLESVVGAVAGADDAIVAPRSPFCMVMEPSTGHVGGVVAEQRLGATTPITDGDSLLRSREWRTGRDRLARCPDRAAFSATCTSEVARGVVQVVLVHVGR